jgi:hypothetical protein
VITVALPIGGDANVIVSKSRVRQPWQNKVEAPGGVVLAAGGADTLGREAVEEHPLALLAVPPIGLGVVRSWHISGEIEVEGRGGVVLLVLAARGADSLRREAVKEDPLALLAVSPIGLGWHMFSLSTLKRSLPRFPF